jgi:hypothetical protein
MPSPKGIVCRRRAARFLTTLQAAARILGVCARAIGNGGKIATSFRNAMRRRSVFPSREFLDCRVRRGCMPHPISTDFAESNQTGGEHG